MLRLTRSQFVRSGLGATFLCALGDTAQAQDPQPPMAEAEWQPLTDDRSRAQLFEREVIPFGLREQQDDSVVTLAIPPVFYFPDDVKTDRIENKPRQNVIFGIDISHHLSNDIDFSLLKLQRVGFVYCKATQGVRFKDEKFERFWKSLGKLSNTDSLPRGAYHFLSSDSPGKDQADRYLDYVRLQGDFQPGDLPPVLDLEWDVTKTNPDRWRGLGKQYILDQTLGCLERIKQRSGKTPIVYTAKAWFSSETIPLSEFSKLAPYPLWIADYNNKRKLSEKPDVPGGARPLLWQFTDRSRMTTGFDGGLDASVFYGTSDEFRKAFGLS
jgi:lysozyme